jgi:hypothetical protein
MLAYHRAATTIQRHFRGWYVRSMICDVRARREYIQALTAASSSLLQQAESTAVAQAAEERQDQEERDAEILAATATKLHHLRSTRAIPGVYNPPNQGVPLLGLSTADEYLEQATREHLAKEARRRMRRPDAHAPANHRPPPPAEDQPADLSLLPPLRSGLGASTLSAPGRTSRSLSRNAGGLPQGPFRPANDLKAARDRPPKPSVQASVPFGVETAVDRIERKIAKSQRIAPTPELRERGFVVPARHISGPPGSGMGGTPYSPGILRDGPYVAGKGHGAANARGSFRPPVDPVSWVAPGDFKRTVKRVRTFDELREQQPL